MSTVVHIEGKLLWKWGRTKSGHYIAICDPIAQTVQAGQFGELLESINEALESTFRELFSTGDLGKFLLDRGWKPSVPVEHKRKNVRFDMPFELKGMVGRDLEKALC